jgi:hypothetical protein
MFEPGVVIGIFKAGDTTLAANYRPITLLNTDYRLLARVLATRLQQVLGQAISPTQTAFIKKRRIGHNIITVQLLLHALPADSTVVAALLDFAKAYDTLDRPFLVELMHAMGVDLAYCRWVKTLLTNTRACACMNGFVSGMRMFYAGVRQGCPLSPLLYLFVGEALLQYLQSKGIHITIHGIQLSATQFADDTQVYLESPAQVAQFLTHMQVMAAASGQKLNLHKSKLLLLGAAARQQHSALLQQHASGALALSPVLQANVLGICVGSDAPVDW